MKCLKCGNSEGYYCEECHQKLIAENLALQVENKELQKRIEALKTSIKLICEIEEELK